MVDHDQNTVLLVSCHSHSPVPTYRIKNPFGPGDTDRKACSECAKTGEVCEATTSESLCPTTLTPRQRASIWMVYGRCTACTHKSSYERWVTRKCGSAQFQAYYVADSDSTSLRRISSQQATRHSVGSTPTAATAASAAPAALAAIAASLTKQRRPTSTPPTVKKINVSDTASRETALDIKRPPTAAATQRPKRAANYEWLDHPIVIVPPNSKDD